MFPLHCPFEDMAIKCRLGAGAEIKAWIRIVFGLSPVCFFVLPFSSFSSYNIFAFPVSRPPLWPVSLSLYLYHYFFRSYFLFPPASSITFLFNSLFTTVSSFLDVSYQPLSYSLFFFSFITHFFCTMYLFLT
jgi:hypothetical protein